jgi:hypothetical protein
MTALRRTAADTLFFAWRCEKDTARSPKKRILRASCCKNIATKAVLDRFIADRRQSRKKRLPSAVGMVKMRERWRDDHRHTRICGRR